MPSARTTKEGIWELRAQGLSEREIARLLELAPELGEHLLRASEGSAPSAPASGAVLGARRARGDLARRSPAASRHARSPGRSAAPTRRSRVRSAAAAVGGHTAPMPPSARPGVGPRRPRPTKLELCGELRRLVIERLNDDNSPEQIAGWLRIEYPDNEAMQVSHETIYRALYVQARGTLKRELTKHLRRGRSRRYARSQSSKRQGQGKITEMVMISERPPEVEDRAVPGHWEGRPADRERREQRDRDPGRALDPLLPAHRPARGNRAPRRSPTRCKASITTLPAQLRRSLTWDQGSEMSEHRRFSVETGVDVYFCDPQSPWQRGSQK